MSDESQHSDPPGLAGRANRPRGRRHREVNLSAALDLLETSRSQGVGTQVPEFLRGMMEKAVVAGRGDESYMSMIELIRVTSH